MNITAMCQYKLGLGIPGILLALIGCTTLGPNYRPPEAQVEEQWLEADAKAIQTGDTSAADWWTVFNDPVLNTLVQEAHEQNLPLQVAGLRIMQARAQLGIAIGCTGRTFSWTVAQVELRFGAARGRRR